MSLKTIKKKFLFTLVFIFLTPFFISGCQNNAKKLTPTHAQIVVFGTYVDITVYTADSNQAQQAIQSVETRFQQFHQEWHAWEKGGIISRINESIASQKPIEISDSIKQFILKSQKLSQQSDYLFDPGIGKLIALWGFHSEEWHGPPPSEKQIQNWLDTRPSIADIELKKLQLTSQNPDVHLDFGGNAKGLALDLAMQQLQQSGIKNAIVNIGGDMRVIGTKNQQAWRIGVQNPHKPNTPIAMVELSGNKSVVTSGTYQRFFEWQGQQFSHILDPNTGKPAQSFASVTVIHEDATTADSAATALLIAGHKNWKQIAQQMGIQNVFIIDREGQTLQTKSMTKRIQLLSPN
ncbi:MAG: FAD:protein FMN transferase [Pseudomonadota bacterium]|nr:FAD:protein FMN transferase [Pseudomonadota bacterium]